MGKLSTDKLVCENGHRIGFRLDKSDVEGWYTARCIQCGGQPGIQFTCPYCGNKRAFMWLNANNDDNVLVRCTKCEKWGMLVVVD
jgi:hypothetical protein